VDNEGRPILTKNGEEKKEIVRTYYQVKRIHILGFSEDDAEKRAGRARDLFDENFSLKTNFSFS
jgi:hypothetical protein